MMIVGVSGWQVDKVQGLGCVQFVYKAALRGRQLPLLFFMTWTTGSGGGGGTAAHGFTQGHS